MPWFHEDQLHTELTQAGLSIELYEPLLTIQSLTVGLEALKDDFSVNLLFLGEKGDAFSRQVVLQLSGIAVIWAESLCDQTAHFWCDYLNCGTQSLGRKLFSGENVIDRSAFSYQIFEPHELPSALRDHCQTPLTTVVARRSTFYFNQESLTLTEYYLPTLQQFASKS